MKQGKIDSNKLSPLHMLHVANVLHHTARKKHIISKVDCTKLISNIVKFLHDKLLKVKVDESLSEEEQL